MPPIKILISKYGALGDTIFITSIIPPLIKQFPDLKLDLLISERIKNLFEFDTRINEIHTLRSFGTPFIINRDKQSIVWRSMKDPYDLLINLDTSKKSIRLSKLIRAKKKMGPPYHTIQQDKSQHVVMILRRFYESFLGTDVINFAYPSLLPAPFSTVREKFSLPEQYLILITTNSSTSQPQQKNFRAWPSQYWNQFINLLSKNYPNKKIILLSSTHPVEIEHVKGLGPFPEQVMLLLGKTNLAELISLIAHAQAIVCTDSGPLHIAAAVNTPIVTLFGPTPWRNTGPFVPENSTSVKILTSNRECSPCYRTPQYDACPTNLCMFDLTPEHVFSKLELLLKGPEKFAA